MTADQFALFANPWPEPMLLVSSGGRIHQCNDAALRSLAGGLRLPGSLLTEFVHDAPEAVQRFLRNCGRTRSLSPGSLTWRQGGDDTQSDGAPFRAEGSLLQPPSEGREALLLIRLRPKVLADRRFQALNERIADLAHEVNARRRAESALVESRARLEFVMESTGVGLWLNEYPLGELNWDARTRELFFVPEGVHPTVELFFDRLHPDDREPTRKAVASAIEGHCRYEMDHRVLDPESGATRWIRSVGMATYSPEGEALRFDGINYDISDRKEIEEELRDLAARLAEADRRKDEFLATLAHELRNPLAPLRTGLEILRMKKDDPAIVETMQITMERQVRQLTVLVNDLLDISRSARGEIRIRTETVRLDEVVRDAVEISRPPIDEAGHRLEISLPDEPLQLQADPYRLAQVISNLLNNAAKYTPPGGSIKLVGRLDGDQIEVKIQDNGLGIPPRELERIFEMFTQLPAERDSTNPGLGVGLTLVKLLVELHGGTVSATSPGEHQGSIFEIRLPALSS